MPLCRRQQSEPVMPGERNVDRNCPVPGVFRPTDRQVPLVTAMARIHHKGLADICAQGFQRIEEPFIVPVFPSTEMTAAAASQLSRAEMRPPPASDINVGEMGDQHERHDAPVRATVGKTKPVRLGLKANGR